MPESRREGTVTGSRLFDSSFGAEADRVRDFVSITPAPQPWMALSRCKQAVIDGEIGPDEFFPEHGKVSPVAVRLCMSCPVRQQCAQWAWDEEVAGRKVYGIVAGLTESQRTRRLRRRGIVRKRA